MMKLVCFDCKKEQGSGQFDVECSCGGLFEVVHDFRNVDTDLLKKVFKDRLAERMNVYASGVWRYKELIDPEVPEELVPTKYEGNTGLYHADSLEAYTGVRKLWLKAQGENPSGSFKDNGMTVAVARGRLMGYDLFACTSTGNTSSSLSMYASIAKAKACVFIPKKDIAINKVLQTLAYGAQVFEFDGNYDDGIRFLQKYSRDLGLYICNSVNPFRIEGQKSIVYEIAQALDWQLPDWIIVPGGALSNAAALGKGLNDLKELGFIDHMPRVAIVQAEGACPFHQMVSQGAHEFAPDQAPRTIASALNIGNPPSWKKALCSLKLTNGVTVSVSDTEILDAKALIDRSGIGCEPASATTVAGSRKLVSQQVIHQEETAVCILTGHILKDTHALEQYHLGEFGEAASYKNVMQSIQLTVEEVERKVGS